MSSHAAFGGKGSCGDQLWSNVTAEDNSSSPGAKVKGREALPPVDEISWERLWHLIISSCRWQNCNRKHTRVCLTAECMPSIALLSYSGSGTPKQPSKKKKKFYLGWMCPCYILVRAFSPINDSPSPSWCTHPCFWKAPWPSSLWKVHPMPPFTSQSLLPAVFLFCVAFVVS